MYFYKSSDDDLADVVLDIYPEQNLKYWTPQRRGLDVGIRFDPHGDCSTPILRNVPENVSEVVLSNKLFDVSSSQLCNHDDAHIILHLHVTHSSSQYHDNCP